MAADNSSKTASANPADVQYDLIVIGGGPAGYTGAIRAAQLGLKTAVIEKYDVLGGTCLNVGCIPSKALLDSSEHFDDAGHGLSKHGVKVSKVELDLPTMMGRKDRIVKELTGGIAYLFGKNKITSITGTASLLSPTQIQVQGKDGKMMILNAKNIMLATGSKPVELPFAKFDKERIISSTEALKLASVPEHLIVIGGGAIGLEMGSVWMRLGAKVTVVEYASDICATMDLQLSKALLKILQKQGMQFLLSTKVSKAEVKGKQVEVSYETTAASGGAATTGVLKGDIVLVAAGRRPYSDGLGLEKVGIQKDERGRVKVDAHLRTNISNIYAVGDLIVGPMLAHKAEEEGVAVAEFIATGHGHVNYDTVPSIIYTWPEVASVGLTEEQLKQKGVAYKSGSFPFSANGRAKAIGMTDGFVKVLADAKTDRVLGVHVIGPRASDVISEATMAMEFAGSSEDIGRAFHAHPTLSEVMREAALAVDKRARQI
jgi:dihydrolipoamide dehydrogenase